MKSNKEMVKKVIDYIENNLEKEINLEKIAEHAGYSKFHLNRIFTQETGSTIYKYLQARRITIAAEKLVKTNMPIAQIAYDAGYNSQQAFSLAFKQIYYDSPKIYRDKGIFIPKQTQLSLLSMCLYVDSARHKKYSQRSGRIEVTAA